MKNKPDTLNEGAENLAALVTAPSKVLAELEELRNEGRIASEKGECALRLYDHHNPAALVAECARLSRGLDWLDAANPEELPNGVHKLLRDMRQALWQVSKAEPVTRNDWKPQSRRRRLTWRERITGKGPA